MIKEIRAILLAVSLICGLFNCSVIGQGFYQFSVDSSAYNDLTGSALITTTPALWDDEEIRVPIGFEFDFFDQTFDSVYISDYVWFATSGNYWIDAYSADFIDRGPSSPSSPRSYKTEGGIGNRIMKIEWNNAGFYCEENDLGTTDDYINVQLWLYEDSNRVEIRYGSSSITDPIITFCGDEGAPVGLKTSLEKSAIMGPSENPILVLAEATLSGIPNSGKIFKFRKCLIPTANFSVEQDSLGYYQFTDSSNNAVSYLWEFGDGTTDTSQNPLHQFSFGSQFSITLTVNGECGLTSAAIIGVITGLEAKNKRVNSFSISPNPCLDYLLVEHHSANQEAIIVSLYNSLGEKIEQFTVINSVQLDLSNYPSGVYYLKTPDSQRLYLKKFIKL